MANEGFNRAQRLAGRRPHRGQAQVCARVRGCVGAWVPARARARMCDMWRAHPRTPAAVLIMPVGRVLCRAGPSSRASCGGMPWPRASLPLRSQGWRRSPSRLRRPRARATALCAAHEQRRRAVTWNWAAPTWHHPGARCSAVARAPPCLRGACAAARRAQILCERAQNVAIGSTGRSAGGREKEGACGGGGGKHRPEQGCRPSLCGFITKSLPRDRDTAEVSACSRSGHTLLQRGS